MTQPAASASRSALAVRFGAFVLERYPFAAAAAAAAMRKARGDEPGDAAAIERTRERFPHALRAELAAPPAGLAETTPRVTAEARWTAAVDDLLAACDGFLRRAAIAATLTPDERREMLRGMALTRATD